MYLQHILYSVTVYIFRILARYNKCIRRVLEISNLTRQFFKGSATEFSITKFARNKFSNAILEIGPRTHTVAVNPSRLRILLPSTSVLYMSRTWTVQYYKQVFILLAQYDWPWLLLHRSKQCRHPLPLPR